MGELVYPIALVLSALVLAVCFWLFISDRWIKEYERKFQEHPTLDFKGARPEERISTRHTTGRVARRLADWTIKPNKRLASHVMLAHEGHSEQFKQANKRIDDGFGHLAAV